MASDTMRMLKGVARAIAGIGAGALIFYETEASFPADDGLMYRAGMAIAAAVMVFILLSSLGKSSD